MKYVFNNLCQLCLCLIPALTFTPGIHAQNINPELLTKPWQAYWIAVPGEPAREYGVFDFRKEFSLQTVPGTFIVHVSADNRYKLFVNGHLASVGPARGDFYFWNYETVDIAGLLKTGANVIAAIVWNEADLRPVAQSSDRTGFVLQGNSGEEAIVNTDSSWKCIRNSAYKPLDQHVPGYYVAGPGEFITMAKNPHGWELPGFEDKSWKKAEPVGWRGATPKGIADATGWMLVPSSIPPLELSRQRLSAIRKAEGIRVSAGFPSTQAVLNIPAKTKVHILLDQSFLTNAYPSLIFSKGKDASISLGYAESLYDKPADNLWNLHKGNRNEVEGKVFIGRKDSIISDGSLSQEFTSLNWRTFRYLNLEIQTKDEALVIEDIFGTFVGYPFQRNARFDAGNQDLQNILDIGWRTARLCAIETYMDCPYYEQLQYIGDARIQALVSLYNSGDDRLMKNALNLMDHSRIPEGITQSRYPSYFPQLIPTFSLWYIGMLHDYWMYGSDTLFVKNKLSGTRQILEFFGRFQGTDGSLKNVPYWLFTDWVIDNSNWHDGVAPAGKDGSSAALDFQLLWAYQVAADMEEKIGMEAYAVHYRKMADQLKKTIQQKYWDTGRSLFADIPEKGVYSQHTNALAILTGTISNEQLSTLANKLITEKDLAPASIYFKYYLHQALIKAGMGNEYLNWLGIWHENIKMGMSTWAEISEINDTRSDCHGWGSSPNIEFFRTVLGIDSDAPGFTKVKIEPHLGALQKASGEIPHPDGKISVNYELIEGIWNITVIIPSSVSGYLLWKDTQYKLAGGENKYKLL